MRSAMAPVMSPTVMIANIPWYIANTDVGIAALPSPVTDVRTPLRPTKSSPPISPAVSGPNASV